MSLRREDLAARAVAGQVLFLDAFSGIAGDMTIAALVDLGVPFSVVEDAVRALDLGEVRVELEQGYMGAVGCSHARVTWEGEHPERSYADIRALIDRAPLAVATRELAQRIFLRLAEAECEVHRIGLDEVHFHEVGAVDAIVDIVGAAACFVHLDARVVASPLPLGRGLVDCRHGVLPLPAPATVACLRGAPTYDARIEAELVTPTGAAIVATVAEQYAAWPPLVPSRIGWGAGTRGLADRPNVLRAVLGEPSAQVALPAPTHAVLEANVDDMTGEVIAHVISRLLEEGALDAWALPCTMKKGRPGLVLSVLAPVADAGRFADFVLRETSSIGVRQSLVTRVELPRSIQLVRTEFGDVPVKVSGEPPQKAKPEFDACVRLSRETGVPLRQVLNAAVAASEELLRRRG